MGLFHMCKLSYTHIYNIIYTHTHIEREREIHIYIWNCKFVYFVTIMALQELELRLKNKYSLFVSFLKWLIKFHIAIFFWITICISFLGRFSCIKLIVLFRAYLYTRRQTYIYRFIHNYLCEFALQSWLLLLIWPVLLLLLLLFWESF